MKWLRHPITHWILGIALGGIFLYAAYDKVLNPKSLILIIWGYRLLPAGPINLMAIYMPWMELALGLGLVTGFKRRAAAFWATALLLAFIAALSMAALRGIDVACGCFSHSATETSNGWLLVLRDLPMLAAALIMLFYPPQSRKTETDPS